MKKLGITYSYNTLTAIALAGFLAGCASEHVTHRNQYSQSTLPSAAQNSVNPVAITPKPAHSFRNYGMQKGAMLQYTADTLTGPYANYYSVRKFIQYMAQKHGFSENYLNGLFSHANRLESVIRLESPAPTYGPSRPGSWSRYRSKFLTDAHINNGADFWRENAGAIQKASAIYGVDPEYIVAIIGVETYFGRNIGNTSTFDSLTTLAFDTHRRAKFFTAELESYLLMTREEGYDPRQPVGSWAGAMGLGQFMPSSFRRLAVDFNNDGRRDLWHEHDAIGSVAHYFSKSGWQYKNPVAKPAVSSHGPSVIELSTYKGNEYWRVYPNFKVIKTYNNSSKYAMAVHQLAQAIKQRVRNTTQIVRSSGAM